MEDLWLMGNLRTPLTVRRPRRIRKDGSFTAITAITATFIWVVAVMRRIWIRAR